MAQIYHSMKTREDVIEALEATGDYIKKNAGNFLGQYPCGLVSLSLEVNIKFDCSEVVCIDVKRRHIVEGE